MTNKLLVTKGSPTRPFAPELEKATGNLPKPSSSVVKVRTFRRAKDDLIREFWQTSPERSHLAHQHDRPAGQGRVEQHALGGS